MDRLLACSGVVLSALSGLASAGEVSGYYTWNWGKGSSGDNNATHSVAFTGLVDVGKAISGYTQNASWCCPALRGVKLLSLGGGNAAGTFTQQSILATVSHSAIAQIKNAGYDGVMYDVEEVTGPSTTTVPAFSTAFAVLRDSGLKVGVTVSHSAPYQTDEPADAVALAKAFAVDPNIDFLSPQLYSSGQETSPQFDETSSCVKEGCTWDLYKDAKAAFVPSIVELSHYAPTIEYFRVNHSIEVEGYFNWAQETSEDKNNSVAGKHFLSGPAAGLVSGVLEGVLRRTASATADAEEHVVARWLQARLAALYPSEL